ncbi:MAG: 1-acyl-sn-glycerol-3-phosphate acyltransferase [Bacteroidota bacterium]
MKIGIHLFILRPFVKFLLGINIFAQENIFHLNRFIIIANHNSHLDILLLFHCLPLKQIPLTHPVAAEEYFSKSKILFSLVNYLFSPIWVTRGAFDSQRDFLLKINQQIERGHNIIIFPEGTRGSPGEILSFKSAIGKIAERYREIPVVPIFLSGPERSFPKSTFIPIPFWNNVLIGPPQIFHESSREITLHLKEILLELSQNEVIAQKKRRRRTTTRPWSIAVLGIDGSGKSTLSRELSKVLSVDRSVALMTDTLQMYKEQQLTPTQPLVPEHIREMLGRYSKQATSLAFYKIPKLTELLLRDYLLRDITRWYRADIVVFDGSPVLNLTAWAILYKEELFNQSVCIKAIKILTADDNDIARNDQIYTDFPELSALKKMKLTHLTLPDLVIFIDVDPATALARIQKRGETTQVHETNEKLAKLRNAYQQVFQVIRSDFKVPTLMLNGELTPDELKSSSLDFIQTTVGKGINHE